MKRLAHRLALAELPMPTAAEIEVAHEEVHDAPRATCSRCHQLKFDIGGDDHGLAVQG